MDALKKEIDEAYKLLSAILVAGENVELMAGAKEHLRKAYRLANEED